jgi:hypothetical protein
VLSKNNLVYNGGDCITVDSLASNIVFHNNYCNGGHGPFVSMSNDRPVAGVSNILSDSRATVAPENLT